MIAARIIEGVPATSHYETAHQALTAPRRASEILNDAISCRQSSLMIQVQANDHDSRDETYHRSPIRHRKDKKQIRVSITSLTNDEAEQTFEVSSLTLQGSPRDEKHDHVRPSPKPVLPSLQISSIPARRESLQHGSGSIAQSPALAKFAITPIDGHSGQTLAKIHSQPSPPSMAAMSSDFKQTLPSLESALSSMADCSGTPYPAPVPLISKLSPTPYSQFGPLPPSTARPPSSAAMSPPRLFSNHSWQTTSQNSSTSAMSEYMSAHGSNNASTPASSVPGQSPKNSGLTLQHSRSEHERDHSAELGVNGSVNGEQTNSNGMMNGTSSLGYPCTWPGCTAAPFQTQYLLNSHTNVHSNQRPHFCPVKDCPRGPGGQGFKRKNEMIRYVPEHKIRETNTDNFGRHGLVHQSPGYVCPFCPDQQHKYPRPDNLQRHVRVHHVEKDRDDPLLREVLAQRPEGGNRGRRRRLGS